MHTFLQISRKFAYFLKQWNVTVDNPIFFCNGKIAQDVKIMWFPFEQKFSETFFSQNICILDMKKCNLDFLYGVELGEKPGYVKYTIFISQNAVFLAHKSH